MANSIGTVSDSELLLIASQVWEVLDASTAEYPGVTGPQVDDLNTFKNTFNTDLIAHVAAQAEAKSKTAAKEASRDNVEAQLRLLRNVAKAGGATDAAMAALGIPTGDASAPSNATVPAVTVNTSERLRHTLEWRDNATPENRKKPRGAMGVEIWVKIDGPPPGSEKDCIFLTLDAFTPYLAEYDAAEAGKVAHYMLRWRMRDGSVSAWSETISATITG
ncbi:MAG: hypothetical protein IPL32_15635 [Chloracidobacterium sp.]|nr:hypothetical protein [Chloracidobacterium sp.]